MGSWGPNSFDGDEPFDWLIRSVSRASDGADAVEKALFQVIGASYLDIRIIEDGVAAAEVVACAIGRRSDVVEIPEEVDDWLEVSKFRPSETLVLLAIAALDAVLTEDKEKSDFAHDDTWLEPDGLKKWHLAVRNLRERLLAGPDK